MANIGIGLGPSDPNNNRRPGGQFTGGSNVGGLSGASSFNVDSSSLDKLSSRLRTVITDVSNLDKVVQALTGSLTKATAAMGKSFGGSTGGGGAGLTVSGFGGQPAGVGPQNRNTSAPVSAFGSATTKAIAASAVGEIGSQWAGQINSGIVSIKAGGMPIDTMSRQSNAIFGGSNSTAGAAGAAGLYAQMPNMSQQDLGGSMAQLQANPFLFAGASSSKQRQLTKFMQSTEGMNPLMGAKGAAQFANTLASGPALQMIQRYGGNATGGALLRPDSGKNPLGINNPQQVFSTLMRVVMGGRNLTSAQLKSMSGGSAQAASSWQMINTNFGQGSQMNLTPAELTELRQFAAAGGSVAGAVKQQAGSGATTTLARTTSQTRRNQNIYQESIPVIDAENKLATEINNLTTTLTKFLGPATGVAAGGASLIHAVTGVAAKGVEAYGLYKGIQGMFGKGVEGTASRVAGPVVGGLVDHLMGGGGRSGGSTNGPASSSTPGTAISVATSSPSPNSRNLVQDGGGALMVSLSSSSITAVGASVASHLPKMSSSAGSHPKPKTASKSGSGGSTSWWDEYVVNPLKDLVGGVAHNLKVGKPPVPVEDIPAGDPPTGSTSTAGMTPVMSKRMGAMMAANPSLKISSGHRTSKQQAVLYALKGGKGVAKPGHSAHQQGKAADVGPPSQFGWVSKNASKFGLYTPAPSSEPWHLQAMGDPTSSTGSSFSVSALMSNANAQLGVPYSWGGGSTTGPSLGIDQGASTVGYDCCLVPETLVYGPNGVKKIVDLVPGDQVWSWQDGRMESHAVVALSKPKKQMTYKLRTNSRTVFASDNHPFLRVNRIPWKPDKAPCRECGVEEYARELCLLHYGRAYRSNMLDEVGAPVRAHSFRHEWVTEWVELKDLKRGDYIVTMIETPEQQTLIDGAVDPENAWLLGLFLADGCIAGGDQVNICVFGEDREELRERLWDRWGLSGTYSETAGYRICSARFARFVQGFDGLDEYSPQKRVPEEVWGWSRKAQEAFVDGYTKGDGSIDKKGWVEYKCSSKEIIVKLRALYISWGFSVSNVHFVKRTRPIIIKGKLVKNALPLHCFEVWGKDRTKQRRINRMVNLNGLSKTVRLPFDAQKILEITPNEIRDTYDIEVEGSHNFVADGVVVHNSGFVREVFASVGITLPRTSEAQAQMGTAVNGIGNAKPGDLLFYAYEGPNSHVALYIGNGKQIAAPDTGSVVQVQNVDTGSLDAIRRIGNGSGAAAAAASAVGGNPATKSATSTATSLTGGGGLVNTFIAKVASGGGWASSLQAGTSGFAGASGGGSSNTTASSNTASTSGAGSTAAPALPTSGSLTAQQVFKLAESVGLSATAARTATAVASIESSFNPQATDHDSNGSTDYGLWQINTINGGSSALYDPTANAQKMSAMTNKGTSWGPWGPDFGQSSYGGNPPIGGKVAAALASLGTLGDPVGAAGTAPMSFSPTPSMSGMRGSPQSRVSAATPSTIHLNMPLQIVNATQQDAQRLVQMVVSELKSQAGLVSLGSD